jgi:hypothetical protein
MAGKKRNPQTGKHTRIKLSLVQPVLMTAPETIIITLLPTWIKPPKKIPMPVLKNHHWDNLLDNE